MFRSIWNQTRRLPRWKFQLECPQVNSKGWPNLWSTITTVDKNISKTWLVYCKCCVFVTYYTGNRPSSIYERAPAAGIASDGWITLPRRVEKQILAFPALQLASFELRSDVMLRHTTSEINGTQWPCPPGSLFGTASKNEQLFQLNPDAASCLSSTSSFLCRICHHLLWKCNAWVACIHGIRAAKDPVDYFYFWMRCPLVNAAHHLSLAKVGNVSIWWHPSFFVLRYPGYDPS